MVATCTEPHRKSRKCHEFAVHLPQLMHACIACRLWFRIDTFYQCRTSLSNRCTSFHDEPRPVVNSHGRAHIFNNGLDIFSELVGCTFMRCLEFFSILSCVCSRSHSHSNFLTYALIFNMIRMFHEKRLMHAQRLARS